MRTAEGDLAAPKAAESPGKGIFVERANVDEGCVVFGDASGVGIFFGRAVVAAGLTDSAKGFFVEAFEGVFERKGCADDSEHDVVAGRGGLAGAWDAVASSV